jgi:hypothetical protein
VYWRYSSILPAALALAACAVRPSDTAFTERDSLGIRILESHEPEYHGWNLSSEPAVEIGVAEGPEEYQLYRVYSAMRLDNGEILLTNSGSGELRFYDAEGRFVNSAGRHGGGPGEFFEYSSMRMWRAGSGSVAIDANTNRVNVFDTSGASLSDVSLETSGDAPRVFMSGVFGDGTWLASAPAGGGRLTGLPGDIIRSEWLYLRYTSEGTVLGELLRMPDRPRMVHEYGEIRHFPYIPLAPEPKLAPGGDRLYVARGSAPEVEVRDLDGALTTLIRWDAQDQATTADIWDNYEREFLDAIGDDDQRRQYAHFLNEDLPLPDRVPAVQSLMVDADGNLWVERFRFFWETQPVWDIFSEAGRWLGSIETPEGFDVYDIGVDYVLGRSRDDLGVERVQLFELDRR